MKICLKNKTKQQKKGKKKVSSGGSQTGPLICEVNTVSIVTLHAILGKKVNARAR